MPFKLPSCCFDESDGDFQIMIWVLVDAHEAVPITLHC